MNNIENKNNRLLFVFDYPLSDLGGASKSSKTIINILLKNKYDIHVLEPYDPKEELIDGVKYHYWGKVESNKLKLYKNKIVVLLKTSNKIKPCIIHSQFSQYGFILVLLKKMHMISKKNKTMFTDRDFYSSYSNKYRFIFSKYAYLLDKIICTTQINGKLWKEANCRNRVEVIHNVLEPVWYQYDDNERNLIRRNKGYQESDFVVGFAGRFTKYKRWDDVYKICEKLCSYDNMRFSFVLTYGNGEYDTMQKYIERLNKLLGSKVTIKVKADINEMNSFYYSLDCFVLTSDKESFGRTLLEAASRKCVVIGTNAGGVPEVIGKTENLYRVGDINKATEIIIMYQNDKSRLLLDKEFFFNRFNNEFSREKFEKEICNSYYFE